MLGANPVQDRVVLVILAFARHISAEDFNVTRRGEIVPLSLELNRRIEVSSVDQAGGAVAAGHDAGRPA